MDELKQLKYAQQQAHKLGDFERLNIINQKIFKIREEKRKIKEKEREEEKLEKLNNFIIKKFEKEIEKGI